MTNASRNIDTGRSSEYDWTFFPRPLKLGGLNDSFCGAALLPRGLLLCDLPALDGHHPPQEHTD